MSQNYTLAQIVNGIADLGTFATPSNAYGCTLEYGINGWAGFAKRVGIPQKVAKEFHAADKRKEK